MLKHAQYNTCLSMPRNFNGKVYDNAIATDISITVSDSEIKNSVRMTKI